MTNLDIQVLSGTTTSPAQLIAKPIRHADLVQLARVIAAGDDQSTRLLNALEDLGAIADNAYDSEVDAAVQDIETIANLGQAVCNLTDNDLGQLEFQAAKAQTPSGTVTRLPAQRPEAGAA